MLQVSIDPEDAKKAYYNNMMHLERRGANKPKTSRKMDTDIKIRVSQ